MFTKALRIHNRDDRPVTDCQSADDGMTEQHHKEACDIKNIMRKVEKEGILNHVAQYKGEYLNMATATDFREAMTVLADTNSMWETVPSRIRNEFANDPARYLEFMQNPDNYQAIKDLGLDPSYLPEPPPPSVPDPAEPTGSTSEPSAE